MFPKIQIFGVILPPPYKKIPKYFHNHSQSLERPPLFSAKRKNFLDLLVRKVRKRKILRRPPPYFSEKKSKGGVFLVIGCDIPLFVPPPGDGGGLVCHVYEPG